MINNYTCTDCDNGSLRTKYQGDDILLNIKIKDTYGDYIDLTTFDDITVYAYTDYDDIVIRGSVVAKTGYVSLNLIDNYTYEFVLDSSYTTFMKPGIMKLEINLMKETVNDDIVDGHHNSIAVTNSLFYLASSNIRNESNPVT